MPTRRKPAQEPEQYAQNTVTAKFLSIAPAVLATARPVPAEITEPSAVKGRQRLVELSGQSCQTSSGWLRT